jgi:hypothetical protein
MQTPMLHTNLHNYCGQLGYYTLCLVALQAFALCDYCKGYCHIVGPLTNILSNKPAVAAADGVC